ncbi:hypothetical protein U9M48_033620 [Paspalum notatum var. saurae]|uniref:ABC transmembrane type-1 domain-containing protein n=1 Tax=Paspalum notatum var. saurae TaxID=547442 RepID=A0AAQ3X6R5_PASNO
MLGNDDGKMVAGFGRRTLLSEQTRDFYSCCNAWCHISHLWHIDFKFSTAIKVFYEPPEELQKDSRFWASMFVVLGICSFVLITVEYFLFGLAGGKLVERIRSMTFQRIITVVIPFVGFQAYAQMKFLNGLNRNAKLKYEEASQVVTDAVGGIRTVASFSAENKVMDAYEKKCGPLGIKEGVLGGLGFGFSFLAFYCTYALCFYVGARFVQQGTATFQKSTDAVSRISALGSDSTKANDSAVSIFEILDHKSKIDYSSEEGVAITSVRGDIDFQKIWFRYPLRPNVQIFKDLSYVEHSIWKENLTTIALVGESGSGKSSTVISLLERFYDPDSGMIFFDGVALETLRVSWLRQQVDRASRARAGAVQRHDPQQHSLWEASTSSSPRCLTGTTPWLVREGGSSQVGRSRAIVKDPRIGYCCWTRPSRSEWFREALDQNHRVGGASLGNHQRGRADIIAVLKNGSVSEKGRHEELMRIKDGTYASLDELSSTSA